MNTATGRIPFYGPVKCYACDSKSVGFADRSHDGEGMVCGCKRHADPTIRTFAACVYCSNPVRSGSVEVDGNFAHAKCHAEACK